MSTLHIHQDFFLETISRCISKEPVLTFTRQELVEKLQAAHDLLLVLIESKGAFQVRYGSRAVSSDEAIRCAASALSDRQLNKKSIVPVLVQTLRFVFHAENQLEASSGPKA